MRLLILGGTTEASALARRIADRPDIEAILSLAGRTRNPAPPPIPYRIGGFGGVEGLTRYLATERIDRVIDATHPFAERISAHAATACAALAIPLAILTRPPWQPVRGDHWIEVADMAAAADALGTPPRRVFLTVGALQLAAFATAPQHHYLVRSIDPPAAIAALPDHRLILARGPFTIEGEIAVMREARIESLVAKNSGGSATEPKLAAARMLGIPVVLVRRPPPAGRAEVLTVDSVWAWIDQHRVSP